MIRKATCSDIDSIAHLALLLWSENDYEGIKSEMSHDIQSEDAGIFLHFEDENVNFTALADTRQPPPSYLPLM